MCHETFYFTVSIVTTHQVFNLQIHFVSSSILSFNVCTNVIEWESRLHLKRSNFLSMVNEFMTSSSCAMLYKDTSKAWQFPCLNLCVILCPSLSLIVSNFTVIFVSMACLWHQKPLAWEKLTSHAWNAVVQTHLTT